MKDGIYFVIFKSNNQEMGMGTVVVKNNTVNGGDFGYSYKGSVENNSIILTVEKHNPLASSVFGNINAFQLELNINEISHGYLLRGGIKGLPGAEIVVDSKYIGDLVI